MYNGTVSFQLDQEWLQEVGGVCEGEDLDRMMAQAIAMETNQQATSNDHLFGIDDRFRREDHYANVVKGGFIQCVLIEFHSREIHSSLYFHNIALDRWQWLKLFSIEYSVYM